jgi:hypothetical protein
VRWACHRARRRIARRLAASSPSIGFRRVPVARRGPNPRPRGLNRLGLTPGFILFATSARSPWPISRRLGTRLDARGPSLATNLTTRTAAPQGEAAHIEGSGPCPATQPGGLVRNGSFRPASSNGDWRPSRSLTHTERPRRSPGQCPPALPGQRHLQNRAGLYFLPTTISASLRPLRLPGYPVALSHGRRSAWVYFRRAAFAGASHASSAVVACAKIAIGCCSGCGCRVGLVIASVMAAVPVWKQTPGKKGGSELRTLWLQPNQPGQGSREPDQKFPAPVQKIATSFENNGARDGT